MYHSHTDEIADVYAGLVGPIVITKAAPPARTEPRTMSTASSLSSSRSATKTGPYLKRNVDRFAGDPGSVDPDDEEFDESNLMHSINGYVFGDCR